jgi:putative (di)nucleoside polyphosphate hydrolase
MVPTLFDGVEMLKYRPNVALILRNAAGAVLVCERTDIRGAWQFPQGGIKDGETPEQALAREVSEEIGLSPESYVVKSVRGPYRYLFDGVPRKKGYDGQEQIYFLAEFRGGELRFPGGAAEFCAAQWVHPADFDFNWLPPMKRGVYRQVLKDFFGIGPRASRNRKAGGRSPG